MVSNAAGVDRSSRNRICCQATKSPWACIRGIVDPQVSDYVIVIGFQWLVVGPKVGSRCASGGRQQRDVHVHFVLAHRGHRAVRHVEHGVLHRRDCRKRHRQGRAVVHSGRAVVQLRHAGGVHRKLLAVCARRRVSHCERSDGRAFWRSSPFRRCCSITCSPGRSAACRPGNTSSV